MSTEKCNYCGRDHAPNGNLVIPACLLKKAETLERELADIGAALTESGTAIGNEHNSYSAAERIRHITKQRDYCMGALDDARRRLNENI